MPHYSLRTLLILLAIGPAMLGGTALVVSQLVSDWEAHNRYVRMKRAEHDQRMDIEGMSGGVSRIRRRHRN